MVVVVRCCSMGIVGYAPSMHEGILDIPGAVNLRTLVRTVRPQVALASWTTR